MKTLILTVVAAILSGVGSSAHAVMHGDAITVLARARAASGGAAWDRVGAISATGEERTSGLTGRWRGADDLRNGRTINLSDFGVYRVGDGFDGTMHWRQDASGGIHPLDSTFAKQATITDAWLAQRGWLQPGTANATLGPVEQHTDNGKTYSTVVATPRGGQAVELWFSTDTGLLDRNLRVMPISIVTTRYGDYREVAGLKLPFAIASNDDGGGNDDLISITNYQTRTEPQPGDFARPAIPDDTRVPREGTVVPVVIDGDVTIEAKINGQGPFAFILDTGGHDILTPDVARQLGLKPVGSGASGGAGEGTIAQQDVRIARVEIGSAAMTDQHFFVIPLQYSTVERGARAPLAGIIGLELFERFAVQLDYRAKQLTLHPQSGFRHRGGGTPVHMTFGDDMPLVDASLDGQSGDFAIDTGNSGSLIAQRVWAERHGLAARMKAGVELVSYGAGGASRNWASRMPRFEIAGKTVRDIVARYAEDKHGSFSSRTEAGNIGTDVLANFTLDFDYAHGTIWFEPVPGFAPMPFDRSGIRAYKDRPEAFTVALVSPGTAAAEAGVQKDDELVAIDGAPALAMSGLDLRRKLTQPVGTVVALSLRHKGAERRVTLKLRDILP